MIKAGLSSQIQIFHRYRDLIKIDQGRPFITDTEISQIQRFDQGRPFTDTEGRIYALPWLTNECVCMLK